MQDNLRLFVAVPLPPALMQYLLTARQVYTTSEIRMVPDQNLHLTLFFIGNVPVSQLDSILKQLEQIAQQHQPFTLALEQLEPGPKRSSPRLIWARFQALEAFEKLSLDLTKAFAVHPPKQDKFIPHVTVSRFKKDARPSNDLPLIQPEKEVLFSVGSMALWQSTLGSPHPVYTVVKSFALGKESK